MRPVSWRRRRPPAGGTACRRRAHAPQARRPGRRLSLPPSGPARPLRARAPLQAPAHAKLLSQADIATPRRNNALPASHTDGGTLVHTAPRGRAAVAPLLPPRPPSSPQAHGAQARARGWGARRPPGLETPVSSQTRPWDAHLSLRALIALHSTAVRGLPARARCGARQSSSLGASPPALGHSFHTHAHQNRTLAPHEAPAAARWGVAVILPPDGQGVARCLPATVYLHPAKAKWGEIISRGWWPKTRGRAAAPPSPTSLHSHSLPPPPAPRALVGASPARARPRAAPSLRCFRRPPPPPYLWGRGAPRTADTQNAPPRARAPAGAPRSLRALPREDGAPASDSWKGRITVEPLPGHLDALGWDQPAHTQALLSPAAAGPLRGAARACAPHAPPRRRAPAS